MKRIRISVEPPLLPPEENVTHIATSYQASKSLDMDTDVDSILAENIYDTTNKIDWYTTVDVEEGEVVFVRAKYHFIADGAELSSEWSLPIIVDGRSSGLTINSDIVMTPTVKVDYVQDQINITTSKFDVFAGNDQHLATTYSVKDSNNKLIFRRAEDENNLTNVNIKNVFEKGKIYTVEAEHINAYNVASNPGKKLFNTGGNELKLFEFSHPEDFIVDRKCYFKVKIWTARFKSYNIQVRDERENVLVQVDNIERLVAFFIPDGRVFKPYSIYTIHIALNLVHQHEGETVTTTTLWKKVFQGPCKPNYIINHRPYLPYPGKYAGTHHHYTDGLHCGIFRELFDFKFVGIDFKDNFLYLLKKYNGELEKIKEIHQLENSFDLDYVNVHQLPNHDILVDIVTYDNQKQATTQFFIFDYNPILYTFDTFKVYERIDERYSTAVANSMVVLDSGKVFYIPAFMTDVSVLENEREVAIDLKLRMFDPEELEIRETSLMNNERYNVGLFRDMNNNVYYFGGSFKRDNDPTTNEYIWEMEQRKVYKLIQDNDLEFEEWTWEEVATIPEEVPLNVYCMQAILRQDGKIIFFNVAHSGGGIGWQNTLIFDPVTATFAIEPSNLTAGVPLRSAYIYQNGDIERVTSMAKDPQYTYTYFSDTRTYSDKPNVLEPETDNRDLLVNDGEAISIENIYYYNRIRIRGTGKLFWRRTQGITILDSKTLIVNKDMEISQQAIDQQMYKSVLILGDARLTVTANENLAAPGSRAQGGTNEKYIINFKHKDGTIIGGDLWKPAPGEDTGGDDEVQPSLPEPILIKIDELKRRIEDAKNKKKVLEERRDGALADAPTLNLETLTNNIRLYSWLEGIIAQNTAAIQTRPEFKGRVEYYNELPDPTTQANGSVMFVNKTTRTSSATDYYGRDTINISAGDRPSGFYKVVTTTTTQDLRPQVHESIRAKVTTWIKQCFNYLIEEDKKIYPPSTGYTFSYSFRTETNSENLVANYLAENFAATKLTGIRSKPDLDFMYNQNRKNNSITSNNVLRGILTATEIKYENGYMTYAKLKFNTNNSYNGDLKVYTTTLTGGATSSTTTTSKWVYIDKQMAKIMLPRAIEVWYNLLSDKQDEYEISYINSTPEEWAHMTADGSYAYTNPNNQPDQVLDMREDDKTGYPLNSLGLFSEILTSVDTRRVYNKDGSEYTIPGQTINFGPHSAVVCSTVFNDTTFQELFVEATAPFKDYFTNTNFYTSKYGGYKSTATDELTPVYEERHFSIMFQNSRQTILKWQADLATIETANLGIEELNRLINDANGDLERLKAELKVIYDRYGIQEEIV